MCHGAEEAVPMTHYLLFSGVPSGREKLKEIVDQQNNNRQNRDQDDEDHNAAARFFLWLRFVGRHRFPYRNRRRSGNRGAVRLLRR